MIKSNVFIHWSRFPCYKPTGNSPYFLRKKTRQLHVVAGPFTIKFKRMNIVTGKRTIPFPSRIIKIKFLQKVNQYHNKDVAAYLCMNRAGRRCLVTFNFHFHMTLKQAP